MPGGLQGTHAIKSALQMSSELPCKALPGSPKDASDSTQSCISARTQCPISPTGPELSSWHGSSSISEGHRGSSPAGHILDLGQLDSLPSVLPPARPDPRPFTMGGCFSKPKPGTPPSLTASPSLCTSPTSKVGQARQEPRMLIHCRQEG